MDRKIIFRISAVVCGISGIIILLGVIVPIVGYQPVSQQILGSQTTDYTRASNWFTGGAKSEDFVAKNVGFYNLSIPKLNIDNAVVAIGGDDLSKSLVQYPGTALPGKDGNTVIFGHSILPLFYNPKSYMSVFSTLPTLKPGDEIFVNYDGVSFVYKVEALFEVLPTDIQVLEQDDSDSFLSLVTCVPPGDPRDPRRLIVRARVVPI
ncbi:MAG: sortase [Candidatus Microgenomates bacterium]|jgi:sortase A